MKRATLYFVLFLFIQHFSLAQKTHVILERDEFHGNHFVEFASLKLFLQKDSIYRMHVTPNDNFDAYLLERIINNDVALGLLVYPSCIPPDSTILIREMRGITLEIDFKYIPEYGKFVVWNIQPFHPGMRYFLYPCSESKARGFFPRMDIDLGFLEPNEVLGTNWENIVFPYFK